MGELDAPHDTLLLGGESAVFHFLSLYVLRAPPFTIMANMLLLLFCLATVTNPSPISHLARAHASQDSQDSSQKGLVLHSCPVLSGCLAAAAAAPRQKGQQATSNHHANFL